jgi:hypothetical protein
MGGHAILAVAAKPLGSTRWLIDYVHLRVGGTNPGRADVLAFIDDALADRDANVVHAVKAIYAHESNFTQFKSTQQTQVSVTFRQGFGHLSPVQPNCTVAFDFPNDPPNFPLATFDFGIGISQLTWLGDGTPDWWKRVAWDWRQNALQGINHFFSKMLHNHQANDTWKTWIWRSWKANNGSGDQATAYANTLQASPEGALISAQPAPANWQSQCIDLSAPSDRNSAPPWPPA